MTVLMRRWSPVAIADARVAHHAWRSTRDGQRFFLPAAFFGGCFFAERVDDGFFADFDGAFARCGFVAAAFAGFDVDDACDDGLPSDFGSPARAPPSGFGSGFAGG